MSVAVPVLRVADVGRSMEWYRSVLGFEAEPFPPQPPHEFAIMRRGSVEVMLRHTPYGMRAAKTGDFDVYVRLEGGDFRAFLADVSTRARVARGPEKMPYGDVEFDLLDPDGYRLCFSEVLADSSGIPVAGGEPVKERVWSPQA
jgi:uncharacterized glyoxalase superfamily protein PhnB